MRIRAIKPDFFVDEDLAELEPLDRLTFVGLWCAADRAGRLEDRPQRLAALILPYEPKGFDARLDRLTRARFLVRYQADGRRLIAIRTWEKHQKPHHTEAPSRLPAPPPPDPPEGMGNGVLGMGSVHDASAQLENGDLTVNPPLTPVPAKVRKPRTPETGSVAVYRQAFEARYGSEPHPSRQDCIAASKALGVFDEGQAEKIVRAFVADEDPWLCARAHRLGLLPGQIDRIVAGLNGKLSAGRATRNLATGFAQPAIPADDRLAYLDRPKNRGTA